MAMVEVGVVGVAVNERLVRVRVRVGFPGRVLGRVSVLVVLVMGMEVLVEGCLMPVEVGVALG